MTRWERLGGALFRARSATPVALVILALAWPTPAGLAPARAAAGLGAAAAGEAMRLWAVGVAGKRTRTRGTRVKSLVTAGPFALVRNPLYIGNFLVGYGLVVLSKVGWLHWAFPLLFFVQYSAIVAWEERVLANAFGAVYESYRSSVGRWVPRPGARRSGGAAQGPGWRAAVAWRSERDTIVGVLALAAALAAKHTALHEACARVARALVGVAG